MNAMKICETHTLKHDLYRTIV